MERMRIAEIASKVTRTSVSFPLKKSSRNRGSGVLWFLPPLHQSLNAWMEERRKQSLAFNGWRVKEKVTANAILSSPLLDQNVRKKNPERWSNRREKASAWRWNMMKRSVSARQLPKT